MSSSASLHPAEVKLLERSQELGLNDQETELIRDLLGWNTRGKGLPKSYRGLEPHLAFYKQTERATLEDLAYGEAIAKLLRHLIGEEAMVAVEANPRQALMSRFGMSPDCAAWVTLQAFRDPRQVKFELDRIGYQAPELMHIFVIPAIEALLTPR